MSEESIHIALPNGYVVKFDCIATELYRHLGSTFHTSNVIRKELTAHSASVSYGFAVLSLIYRFKILSDEDFIEFQKLPMAEQYTVAFYLTRCCYELNKIEETSKIMLAEIDMLLREQK